MQASTFISKTANLPEKSIKNTLTLLKDGASLPFIARYRKDITGNLDEVKIGVIQKQLAQFEKLEKRKESVIKNIEAQGLLNKELQLKIEQATDLNYIDDLYLPYKQKRQTKAEIARKAGLEPLAKIIMSQRSHTIESNAKRFVSKAITSSEEAIKGAQHIIAEWVSENTVIRSKLRRLYEHKAMLTSKLIKTQANHTNAKHYEIFFDFTENLMRIPAHRLMAILRAEKEGIIRVKIDVEKEQGLRIITPFFIIK